MSAEVHTPKIIQLPNGAELVDLPQVDLNRLYHPHVAAAYRGVSVSKMYKDLREGRVRGVGDPIRIPGSEIAADHTPK